MCVCVCCVAAVQGRARVCVWGGGVVWGGGAGRDVSVCGWACMCGVWAETEAERHSQAKDNALCVCMCVRAHVVGVCVWGLGVHGLFVGGGGDRVRMRVCTPCGAGGVCVRVPGVCLGMVQAERDAARRKGRRSVCVCVCVVCTRGVWCAGGQRQRDAARQRITCMDGYPPSFCLCFLTAFITSPTKTTPVTCDSATSSPHLVFGQADAGVWRVGGRGRGARGEGRGARGEGRGARLAVPRPALILALCP